jgi:hypothetical protein
MVSAEPAFLPVAVPAASPWGPVLVSPRGYRVEGLEAEVLATLLERLG